MNDRLIFRHVELQFARRASTERREHGERGDDLSQSSESFAIKTGAKLEAL
jgi:hypothetical protein